jgi:hypothetical protein
MQKFYVQYDSSGAVIGRLSSDGDVPSGNYLEVTDAATMAQTINDGWTVASGLLVQPTSEQLLSTAQSTQIAAIEADYQVAIQQPVAYMNTTFQADKDSQDLMNRAITGLQAIVATGGTVPDNFAWYDINNHPVTMTLIQLQGLFATGVANVNTLFVHKQTQKAAIRAATTVSAVTKIVW